MVLEEGLEGYKEYKKKVKYKVIPFIWLILMEMS